ncbi:MAG: tail fiber domain-containing protein [Bacteroidia bacterium]
MASGGNINYGVRAQAPTTPNSYAGSFLGNVEVVGTGTANAWLTSSDRRYKQDIKGLESVNEKLEKLNGYTYSMRTDEFKDKNFATAQQIGLIAQEVQEVFPQLVHEDGKGYLAVNYDGMVPVLLEALKEQQQQIDALKSQVAALSLNPGATNGQVIDLSNVKAIVLDQNAPNPFAEQTVIHYALPTEVRIAKMLFHDGSGNLVQSVDITDRGNGRLIVYGTRLAAGAYTYSLMADGKIVDTKVMVKQ